MNKAQEREKELYYQIKKGEEEMTKAKEKIRKLEEQNISLYKSVERLTTLLDQINEAKRKGCKLGDWCASCKYQMLKPSGNGVVTVCGYGKCPNYKEKSEVNNSALSP